MAATATPGPPCVAQIPTAVATVASASMPTGPNRFTIPQNVPIPEPSAIESQKVIYTKSLDEQLDQGAQVIQQQNQAKKNMLYESAQQQKVQLALQVDQQTKMQEMALDEQTNRDLMDLKHRAFEQRAVLEQQAAALVLEYQQRKMHEEFVVSQSEMQRQYMESAQKIETEAQKYMPQVPIIHPNAAVATNPYAPQMRLPPAAPVAAAPCHTVMAPAMAQVGVRQMPIAAMPGTAAVPVRLVR